MKRGDVVDTIDILSDTAAKVCCLADLMGSSDVEQLFFSDQGMQGMCLFLNSIQSDIQKAERQLSQALSPPPEAAV